MNALIQTETLDALRNRLPEYLEAAGVELRRNGSRLVGLCPVHQDRTPSFAVFGNNLENCGCHPCDFQGDVFAVSQWLGRSSTFPDAVKDVAAAVGINPTQEATTRPPRRAPRPTLPPFKLIPTDREKIDVAKRAFTDAFWSGNTIVDDIAKSIGISRETLRWASWGTSGLGIDSPAGLGRPWLCYRYAEGLKWRNPNPKSKPRFVWLAGKALAPWRSEWIKEQTKTVYLTEGESDCLALISAGLEADGTAVCCASPGTSFPREWASFFAEKRVIICFDHDQAGQAAAAKVAAILKGHAAAILKWKGVSENV